MDEQSEWLRIGKGFICTAFGCPARPAVLVRSKYVTAFQRGESEPDDDVTNFACESHSGLSSAEIATLPFAGSPFTGDADGSIKARYDKLLREAGLVDEASIRSRTSMVLAALAFLLGLIFIVMFLRAI